MIKMAANVGQDFSRSKEQLTDGDGDGDEDDGEEILDPRVKVEKVKGATQTFVDTTNSENLISYEPTLSCTS